MTHYIGILDGERDVWGVWLPDWPGVHGGGPTPDDAIRDAISALSEIASFAKADGKAFPRARDRAEVLTDIEVADALRNGDVLVAIPLLVDSGRPTKANISLDEGLLALIDAEARLRGLTRSAFLASAARDKIESGR
jgi:predicted RNase H-like HicB family nuclease